MNIAHTLLGDIEYRLEGTGSRTALILHGGHMNAGIKLGEEYFLERGYKVLAVSRPGYGRTPLGTGTTPGKFADALVELLDQVGIANVLLIGVSAGGRTAIRFAAKCPTLTDKLILQSSISFAPWPDRMTRLTAYAAFNSFSEKQTWKLMRYLLKKSPEATIKMMIGNMTLLDPDKVVSGFNKQQLLELTELFAHMDSGSGFMNDIKSLGGDATDVPVPTLIIHSKYDKTVPLEHPRLLAQQINNSHLHLSEAESHLLWFSPHYGKIKNAMDEFLRK